MIEQNTILITGDFCPVKRPAEFISSGDSTGLFDDILPIIRKSSLAITNLECPLTDSVVSIDKVGPSLKAPTKTAKFLKDAGFSLVTLANNHIMDFGLDGLNSTFESCNNSGLSYVGAGSDLQDAGRIFKTELGNKKIAILNFTENEYSIAQVNCPGANPLDIPNNFRDISKIKKEVDYVIVIVHGGHELYDLPSPRIKSTFRFYAEAGASIVIGHHSHFFSGYEIYNSVPLFYGLGNLIFDSNKFQNSKWNIGYAVMLTLGESLRYEIIPYEQCNSMVCLRLLEGTRLSEFETSIKRINSIISVDSLLEKEFSNYCETVRKRYLSFLEPHSFILLHYLRFKRLFPSLLTKRKRNLYLNLFRCESHREVVINLLQRHLSK